MENSVCLLRNLSYQVHREVPGCERYQETAPVNQGPAPANQKGGCFSSRKGKGVTGVLFFVGLKNTLHYTLNYIYLRIACDATF